MRRSKGAGFGDLGVIISSDEQRRAALLRMLDELFANRTARGLGRNGCAPQTSSPHRSTPCSRRPTTPNAVANGYVTEIDYPKYGKRAEGARLAVAFLGNPGPYRHRSGTRRRQRRHPRGARLLPDPDRRSPGNERSSDTRFGISAGRAARATTTLRTDSAGEIL